MTTITPRDDMFHFDQMSDKWWETETSWFSFCAPDHKLGGWLYSMFRPNIGTVAGGTWIWDGSASLPWEVPYYTNYTCLRIPENPDLRDISLPTGVGIRMREPLKRYDLQVSDKELLTLNLTFDAVMEPRPLRRGDSVFSAIGHFDQFGRVTGTVVLHGEKIDIDCLSIRDRSWGPRAEHRPPRSAYVTGVASAEHAFLAVTKSNSDSDIAYGFLMRDGQIADLEGGTRTVKRNREHGWVDEIEIVAKDSLGRTLKASGRRVSGIIINRHSFIDSNALIEWEIDGEGGHGEDQDMWPLPQWSAFRRSARSAP